MKSLSRLLGIGALGLALAFAAALPILSPLPAEAVTIRQDKNVPNIIPNCYANASATNYTSTGNHDLTGLTCAFVPFRNDPTTAARPSGADLIEISYSIDGMKYTDGTGNCGVYVNSTRDTTTDRYFSNNTPVVTGHSVNIAGTFIVPNLTAGAQTVKIMCASSNTSTLVILRGHFIVREIVRY